jgi:hypothetical protein
LQQKIGKCLKFLSAIEESGEELKGGKNHPGRVENIPSISKYVLLQHVIFCAINNFV